MQSEEPAADAKEKQQEEGVVPEQTDILQNMNSNQSFLLQLS